VRIGAAWPAARHDQAIANDGTVSPLPPAVPADRARLRLRSLAWALLAALAAAAVALLSAALPGAAPQPAAASGGLLESGVRAAGCGFFYGLLAFHLQRVDPGDSHLQAGLVGAVCALRSLAQPLATSSLASLAMRDLSSLMMDWLAVWLPLWLPLIGSAVLLQSVQRLVPSLRP
jgi:hypothetical protein